MSEELVKRDEQALTKTAMPIGRGLEDADMSSVSMPVVKLMQPTSPELQDEDYGFKAGQIIHGLLMEKMPEKFVPLMIFDDKKLFVPKKAEDRAQLKAYIQMRFNQEVTEDEMQNMFLCESRNNHTGNRFGRCADCGMHLFDKQTGRKPYCTSNVNVISLFDGQEMPIAVRFSKTSYKHGVTLKKIAMYSGGDLFKRKFKLTALKQQKDDQTWYELKAAPAGLCTEEEFANAEDMYTMLRGVRIHMEETEEAAEVEVQEQF